MVKRSRIVAFLLLVITIFSLIGTTSSGIVKDIKLGLDLQGGFEVLYEVKTVDGSDVTTEVLNSTVDALRQRIDVLGVNEPSINIEGEDRVRVQLAGVSDQSEAREMLSTSAQLTFRDFNDNVMLTGSDLKENGAKLTFDENNQPAVSVTLKDANKFKQVTETISAMPSPTNVLAIWLDFEEGVSTYQTLEGQANMISAPFVSQVFNQTSVMITGSFTNEEATNLANLLNAGALPVDLEEIYSTSVGAKFGEDALKETIFAGIIGVLAVYVFMIFFYRFPGIIATVTLTAYVYLILLIFDWMNAVLTLPGIAALILGVGMAVDANVITYERIREELRIGRSVKSANTLGNKTSFITIMDANLTTLLAAGVMFYFGTSSVKGFATMLIISILMGILTNVFVTRFLMSLCVNSGFLDNKPGWFAVKKKDIHDIHETADVLSLPTKFDRFDFVKSRKVYYMISTAFLVLGIIALFIFKLNLSIDFTSGTRLEITADQSLTKEQIEVDVKEVGINSEDIVLSGDNNEIAVVRTVDELTKEDVLEVKAFFNEKYGHDPNISTVSPTVGKELAKNALLSVLIAAVGIIIYVSIRFEWRMGIPAVLALVHDALFIIIIFSIFKIEINLNFIAAVLTIIGYSINDTIVTFDRVRENMKKKRIIKTVAELEEIANVSIRQTMVRTMNTIITVLLTVIALCIFGSESIFTFSLALLLGMVCGVYSSIFIATQLWLDLKKKELAKKGQLITFVEKKKYSDEPQV